MKILNLKINHFGKLENKEIELDSHINLVYGKNESGKSSLLKYIVGMFYGISKNKNGKNITDMDKYTPWFSEDFSGKLKYKLDNGEAFEIYREFKKKNPKIFNENSEDISKSFNIDKTKGNMFFYDQTKVEEELFLSTLVSEQQEVKLDQKSQNTLIQKISNIIGTGEDTVSYQKTIKYLDKKVLEEIGTTRSQDRPINIVKRKISQIENEKEYLMPHIKEKYEITEEKESYINECEKIKNKIEYLKELKELEDKCIVEKEKIEVNKKIEKEYIEKLEQLEKIKLKKEKNKESETKKSILPVITSILSIVLGVILYFAISNVLISLPAISVLIISNIIYVFLYKKHKSLKNKKQKEIKSEVIQIEKEIEQIKNNIKDLKNKVKGMQEKLNENNLLEIERINRKYNEDLEGKKDRHSIVTKLNSFQDRYQNLILKIKKLELEENNILPRLDKLAGTEEELEELKEEERELEQKKEYIELAKEAIEIAYEKMKSEVSPKFANNISKQMEAISGGKYKNIKLNDDKGFMVEIENGDYISADSLSIGTIDQIYLSLRLSVLDDISSEKMPILLDETFAYFDDERLVNIFKYLHTNYSDRQIIVFTCTTREKETLNRINIPYNLVQM